MTSERDPGPAQDAATSSSSVDLPTPGSPASRITAPGTRPPPRTRSSSPTPVGRDTTVSSPTSVIDRTGLAGRTAARGAPPGTPTVTPGGRPSSTVPQPPQPGQRPTHFAAACPHAVHSN